MSHMADLDIQLREAGIDPADLTLEEAIDLLRTIEVNKELDADCANCEAPDFGIIFQDTYYGLSPETTESIVIRCGHHCLLAES